MPSGFAKERNDAGFFSQSLLKFHKRKEVMLDCSSLKSLLQSVDFSILGTSQRSSPQNCTLARGGPGHFVRDLKRRECSKLQQDTSNIMQPAN